MWEWAGPPLLWVRGTEGGLGAPLQPRAGGAGPRATLSSRRQLGSTEGQARGRPGAPPARVQIKPTQRGCQGEGARRESRHFWIAMCLHGMPTHTPALCPRRSSETRRCPCRRGRDSKVTSRSFPVAAIQITTNWGRRGRGGLRQQKFLSLPILETGNLESASLGRIQVWAGLGPLGRGAEKEFWAPPPPPPPHPAS